MALSKDIVIRLLGDSKSAEQAIKAAADAAEVSVVQYRKAEREQTRQAASAEAAAKKQMAAYESVGRGMMIGGAVIAAGLGLAAKAAIDWETAWAGVQKTVDGSPEQMSALESSLRKLATTLPATHEEIAGVAEAAGQLGIKRQDIVEFTKVAIAMGVSTNLSAQDAATGMARLSNIMGTSSKDVDRMGSALVALGNAGASTEGEILDMALRIAAAGRQAGMSEGEVMGLANAMSSLGIEAEAGGTAISTVIKKINSSVLDGGDALDEFARVAGMSSSAFAKAWKDDAASALVTVVQGLGRMQAQGENVNAVIDDLGLDGIRTSDTLLRLAGNSDGLADSLALGNKAWAENSALMNEANKRYDTAASKIQIARNQIADAAIDIGGTLLPVLSQGVELISDFARGFQDLPGWMQDSVAILGLLAATVGLVGGAAVLAVPKLVAFRTVMTTMSTSAGAATTAVGKFGLFMTGPWGAAIGVATFALGGLIAILGSSSRASDEAADYQRDLADALRESGGVIDENTRAIAANKAADKLIGDSNLLEVAKKLGFDLPKVTDALLGNKGAYEELTEAANKYIDESLKFENAGDPKFTQNADNARLFIAALADLSPSVGAAIAANEREAAATEKTGVAGLTTAGSMDKLATATGEVATLSQDAATAAEDLAKAMDNLNGPTLNLRDATRNYKEQLDEITKAMGEKGWIKTLDDNTEAGRENAQMLDDLAKKAAEQAQAVFNTTGSYDAFKNSLEASRDELMFAADEMSLTADEAKALADQILAIPDAASVDITLPTYGHVTGQLKDVYGRIKDLPPNTTLNVGVLSQQAMAALESVGIKTRALPDGTVEVVTSGTGAVEIALNNLVRDRTMTVRVKTVGGVHINGPYFGGGRIDEAQGGIVHAYANGGFESMRGGVAQVVPPNTFRLIGDRVRDDEAYIPINNDARSHEILRQTAGRMGYAMAGGGIGIPVGSQGVGSGATSVVIDYARLGAAVAAAVGNRPTVGAVYTQRNETGFELAEKLKFDARTS